MITYVTNHLSFMNLYQIRLHRDLMSVLSYSLKYSTNVKFVQSVGCKVSL